MGGGGMPEEGGGKKKKKSLDAVINVVPAIDLLSCCITFLLYTAVWTQISRLQIQQAGQSPDPAPIEKQTLVVTLVMGERGFSLSTSSGTAVEIPTLGRSDDGKIRFDLKALETQLRTLKGNFPDAAAITVQAEDTVAYGDLVQAIDASVGAGLVAVTVSGT